MSALVLDSGAWIAVERGDRAMLARLSVAHMHGLDLRSSALVLAQVWRDGSSQVAITRLLRSVDVRGLDLATGRETGELLGRSGTSDVVVAALVLTARSGDTIVTSDLSDIRRLVAAARLPAFVVPC